MLPIIFAYFELGKRRSFISRGAKIDHFSSDILKLMEELLENRAKPEGLPRKRAD